MQKGLQVSLLDLNPHRITLRPSLKAHVPGDIFLPPCERRLAAGNGQRYGQSTEKLDSDIAQLEMRLEDCEGEVGEQLAARPERDRQRALKSREKSGRKPLPPHLPREVVVHEPEIVCSYGAGCESLQRAGADQRIDVA